MDIHSQVLSYDIPVKTLLTTATFRQFFQNREISLKTPKKNDAHLNISPDGPHFGFKTRNSCKSYQL